MTKKRLKKADTAGINKMINIITSNPLMESEELIRKAREMGYDPANLIDQALGAIRYEKMSSVSLDSPIEDILNSIYEKNPTPGKRYILEPKEAYTKRGMQVKEALKNNAGFYSSLPDQKGSRRAPDFMVIKKPYTESEKLKAITDAGHELEHGSEYLIRPDFKSTTEESYVKGHHYDDIYEPKELIREVRELPQDEKTIKEILKQSEKLNVKPSLWGRLRSILGPMAAGAGLYTSLKSGDTLGAALEGTALVDPTGVSDAAAEVYRRSKLKDPEEIKQTMREDKYSAIPGGPSPADIMLDQLEDIQELEVQKEIDKRKKRLGYE